MNWIDRIENRNYSALRLHSYTAVLSALLMYTFCIKSVQNGTVKLIFLKNAYQKFSHFMEG